MTGTTVSGTLDAAPSTAFTLEFFANIAPDRSGFGQGQTYLGSAVVTTDASGHASFTFHAGLSLLRQYVTATATDPSGNTSEFSNDLLVRVPTMTTLGTSPASPVSGQPLTLTATVAGTAGGDVPGGSVTFLDRSGVLGSAPLDASGRASVVIAAPDGADTVTAVYGGSPAYTGSVSALSVVTAAKVTPVVALIGPPGLALTGQALSFVAIVVPSGGFTPTGSVAFVESGAVVAIVPLDASGRATFLTSSLPPGPHVIEASYLGDASDNPGLSSPVVAGVLPSLAFGGPTVTSAAAPTTVKITFSRPLQVGPAQDKANYAVIGPDGRRLAIASAAYDPATGSVNLTTRQPLTPGRSYRVTVDGRRIGGVVDIYGIALDGKRNGRPGSVFAGTIKWTGNVATHSHPAGPSRSIPARVPGRGR